MSGGIKYDTGKASMDLLSPVALEGVATVLSYGAAKYAANNWRKGMAWSRVIASTLRHLFKFISGEDIDPESGLPHIDHVGCNIMFLQEYYRTHKALDDRYKVEPKKEESAAAENRSTVIINGVVANGNIAGLSARAVVLDEAYF